VNRERRGETLPLVTLGCDVGWAVLDDRGLPVKPSGPRVAHDADAAGLARDARHVGRMAARVRTRERR
jgi:hypothetical protein